MYKKIILLSLLLSGLLAVALVGCDLFDNSAGSTGPGGEGNGDGGNGQGEDPIGGGTASCPLADASTTAECALTLTPGEPNDLGRCVWVSWRVSEPRQKRFGYRLEGLAGSANPRLTGIEQIVQRLPDGTLVILTELRNPTPISGAPWSYTSPQSGAGQCAQLGCADGQYEIHLALPETGGTCRDYELTFTVVVGP